MTTVYDLKIQALTLETMALYPEVDPSNQDSGIDVHFPKTVTVPAGARAFSVRLGVACEMIETFKGRYGEFQGRYTCGYWLLPRSSIAKTPLRMSNSVGVIDQGYRGELIAKVDNISDEDFEIVAGTRLFQILNPMMRPMGYSFVDKLSESTRGAGGFGSTGK